jgi:hypothetical protein
MTMKYWIVALHDMKLFGPLPNSEAARKHRVSYGSQRHTLSELEMWLAEARTCCSGRSGRRSKPGDHTISENSKAWKGPVKSPKVIEFRKPAELASKPKLEEVN